MKLSFLLILLTCLQVSASLYSQSTRLNISVKEKSVKEVLKLVESKSKFRFFYSDDFKALDKIVSFKVENSSLESILDAILEKTNATYKILENNIVVISPYTLQQRRVTGTISDASTGEPMAGVNVIVEGTTSGVVTDANGRFEFSDLPKGTALIISFIGYNTERIQVMEQTNLQILLVPDITKLEEVVVVGYGTQKKRDIIGSVSTVKIGELRSASVSNFDAGLQGLAAGVSVQSQSGTPGAASIIKIRGTNSINSGTDPLWIIDGMPVYSSPSGLGSSRQNPMSLINPNDIESVQVLKDAAATAIYGSRASNGVIIVTTKRGKKGEGTLNFNFSTGISSLTRTPDDIGYTNTTEWFRAQDLAYQNTPGYRRSFVMTDYFSAASQADTHLSREEAELIQTDWYNELFHQGTFQDYNVAGSKGFENGNLYMSFNYRKDNGVQRYTSLERYAMRVNVDFKPLDNLTLSGKITLGNTISEKRNSGITSLITYALPWFPVRNPYKTNEYYNAYTGYNPTAMNDPENYLDNTKQYRGIGSLALRYNVPFIKGLTFNSELSADLMQSNTVNWQSRFIRRINNVPRSFASEEAVTFQSVNYNLYGNYERELGDHSFNVVAGTEATRKYENNRFMSGQDLVGKHKELGTPNSRTEIRAKLQEEDYLKGYFLRFNYKFKDKYLLGLSGRRDGSSKFTTENRWGTFFGASAGWVISDEDFITFLGKDIFLKLRGSYGEIGNSNIPSNLNSILYTEGVYFGGMDIYGVNGTLPVNIANNDLKWETTKSTDIGIDFGFMKNRINGSLAYYHRLVTDMLLEIPLPFSAGMSSSNQNFSRGSYDFDSNRMMSNIGDMVNSGIEVEIHSINFERGSFRWSTDFNITFNRNIIKKLTPEADMAGRGMLHTIPGTGATVQISRTGQLRKEWYIADWAGVDRLTGVPMIYVRDDEQFRTTGKTLRMKNISRTDSVTYATNGNIEANRFYQEGKSSDPKYYGGITNTFQYKNFDFSFIISFSGGNYILDYDRQMATVANPTTLLLKEVYDKSWKNIGDRAKYPQIVARGTYTINNQSVSEFNSANVYHNRELYKGDYIRLRNVQLGYTLGNETARKIKLKGLRMYLSASNLFTLTDYPGFDPEGADFIYFSSAIPQLKSFIVGLDVKF